jgi:hypothetical protein
MMTTPTKPTNPTSEFDNFIEVLVDELIAMPDDQVLDGQNQDAVRAHGLTLLQAAKSEAGRRRLAAARQGAVALTQREEVVNEVAVDVAQARRYISQAMNDSRYTLAARSLAELTDDEILRLYRQVKSLEASEDEKGRNR